MFAMHKRKNNYIKEEKRDGGSGKEGLKKTTRLEHSPSLHIRLPYIGSCVLMASTINCLSIPLNSGRDESAVR